MPPVTIPSSTVFPALSEAWTVQPPIRNGLVDTLYSSMNSSSAPLGPRVRNSPMTSVVEVAKAVAKDPSTARSANGAARMRQGNATGECDAGECEGKARGRGFPVRYCRTPPGSADTATTPANEGGRC